MLRKSQVTVLFFVVILLGQISQAAVKNVVLMIGDGMGFEHVKAASFYGYGEDGKLSFEKYYRGEVTTHSANSYRQSNHATDSAASATAMATGQKVNNDVISERYREPIKTILEYLQEKGKATGLVTTVPITHATPAGFGAHVNNRDNYRDIANDYLTQTRPNVLFGAFYRNGRGMTIQKAAQGEYSVVTTRKQMMDVVSQIDQNSTEVFYLAGLFYPEEMPWEYDYYWGPKIPIPLNKEESGDVPDYDTIPHLSEMTSAALMALDNDPNGFFLMVEGGKIDKAAHDNIIERNIYETLEFDNSFRAVLAWAGDRDDTLIIVTADHECGGLKVVKNNRRGSMPDVFWGSTSHTGSNVPMYAVGQGAREFVGVIDNTDIFRIIMKLTSEPSVSSSEQEKLD
ncbi:MAG: alkaline phosphatase [Sedimentisphaerales bacterium]|nr:alkaline phosphatase [Sedimentisphaerales bacterium]